MGYGWKRRLFAGICGVCLLGSACLASSCTASRFGQRGGRSGSGDSAAPRDPAFTSLNYQGLDTNPYSRLTEYATTDQTLMSQVWAAMDSDHWKQTSRLQTGESNIILHFDGQPAGWYLLTPNNCIGYTVGKDHTMSTANPFGNIGDLTGDDLDAVYTVPDTVFPAVAKLLKAYTAAHPPTFDLSDALNSLVHADDSVLWYGQREKYARDTTAARFADPLMKSFGDLSRWQAVSTDSVGNMGAAEISVMIMEAEPTYSLDFYPGPGLACLQYQGVPFWYRVPADVLNAVGQAAKKAAS